jgi:hypothetical protein
VVEVPRAEAWCAGAADGECTQCPAGWHAVYGYPVDDALRGVDLGSGVGRAVLWCFDPAGMVVGQGLVTCDVRNVDGRRFMAPMAYPRPDCGPRLFHPARPSVIMSG